MDRCEANFTAAEVWGTGENGQEDIHCPETSIPSFPALETGASNLDSSSSNVRASNSGISGRLGNDLMVILRSAETWSPGVAYRV